MRSTGRVGIIFSSIACAQAAPRRARGLACSEHSPRQCLINPALACHEQVPCGARDASNGPYWTRFELSLKKMVMSEGSPHPSPHWGVVPLQYEPVFTVLSWQFTRNVPPPTSVGFSAHAAKGTARDASRARQKPPSSLTRPTGSPTDGLGLPCHYYFTIVI